MISCVLVMAGAAIHSLYVPLQYITASCKQVDRQILLEGVQTKYLAASMSVQARIGALLHLPSQVEIE